MAKKQNKESQTQLHPVAEVRIGSVKAAIWRNEGESGPRFNVTFQRLYRTEEGKWQSTYSFGRDDLLVLMKVADATHTRVMELIGDKRGRVSPGLGTFHFSITVTKSGVYGEAVPAVSTESVGKRLFWSGQLTPDRSDNPELVPLAVPMPSSYTGSARP